MLDLTLGFEDVPPQLLQEEENPMDALHSYSKTLIQGMRGEVCALRFKLLNYSLMGPQGLTVLSELLKYAASLGYYTLLDVPGLICSDDAQNAAGQIWGEHSILPCSAVLISGYCGSDVVKPFLPWCEKEKKDLFLLVRSPGRSASEIQDLLAGSRMVHIAAADYANRYGAKLAGKSHYSRVAAAVSATSGDSVKLIRSNFPNLFLLIDGIDQPGGNARNCSYAFDSLGRGAIVCMGKSVAAAWKLSGDSDFVQAAVAEATAVQKRLSRYVTIR